MPKISALPATSSISGPELLPIVQGGTTKQVLYSTVVNQLTSDVAPAVTSAVGSAAAAAADALTASEAADDAAAYYSLLTGISAGNGAYINSLISGETSAIAIHSEDHRDYGMKVVDSALPANNRTGAIPDIISGVWTNPKLCIQSDSRTLKWSKHNLAKQTDAPGSNTTGVTVTTGQTDSDGGTKAALLTSTVTTVAAFQQLTVSSGTYNGLWHTLSWIVRAGTGAFFYVAYNDGSYHHAWFNASTWATGTVDAGITAASYSTTAAGAALPSGYRRLEIQFQSSSATFSILCGMCDADAAKTVTVGRTMYGEKPHLYLGKNTMEYFENTGTSAKIDVPYDYGKGYKAILVEPAATYNSLYGDDLTNAAWTKTNCTAAFTATGPHNEACSTLTATAADGTCIQAIVSAGTSQIFSAYVKRRTGTGSIWMTANNGSTWTEITSSLNSSTYTEFTVNGTTNPSIGFKISTNADAIDVSLAINAATSQRSSPMPMVGASRSRTADNLTIPMSLFTAGTKYTIFVDYTRSAGTGFADNANVRFGTSGFAQEGKFEVVSATGVLSFSVNDGSTTKTTNLRKLSASERVEWTMKLEANKHIASMNGDPPIQITTIGMTATTQLKVGGSAPTYLRRILIVNRAVARDDVRTWRYAAGVQNGVLGSHVAAWDTDPAFANTTMNREPLMCVLSDDGEIADVLVTWMQKHDTGHHSEAPGRLMSRKYRFNKTNETLLALTPAAVIEQQSGWTIGEGHLQSPEVIRLPRGQFEGRLIMLYTALDNPDFSPDYRNVYYTYNDSDGDPTEWATPRRILEAASGGFYIVEPTGACLLLPSTHSVAPNRLLFSMTIAGGLAGTIYSDDWGATWQQGTPFNPPGVAIDETNLTIWPDGTIVATARVTGGAATTSRYWLTSTDGGVTFTSQGALPSYSYTACAAGIEQLDPTGIIGPYGKIAISHPASAANRYGTQIDFATDSAMTFGSTYYPWPATREGLRYFGYSTLKSLFGGTHLAFSVEGGTVPFNTDNSIHVAFLEIPE